jgi:hypothetical protein
LDLQLNMVLNHEESLTIFTLTIFYLSQRWRLEMNTEKIALNLVGVKSKTSSIAIQQLTPILPGPPPN